MRNGASTAFNLRTSSLPLSSLRINATTELTVLLSLLLLYSSTLVYHKLACGKPNAFFSREKKLRSL